MSYPSGIGTRLESVWGTAILGPNGQPWEHVPDLAAQRQRARRLEDESALAAGILDRAVENVIGTGITIRPKSSDPEFNKEIAALWSEWTDGKTADVRRTYSFGELQRLTFRHMLRDGDCGYVLVDRMDEGLRFPELQFFDGEQIGGGYSTNVMSSRVYDGIEYSEVNAPVAYYLSGTKGTIRVEARDFVFMHWTSRYNVGRGQPKFRGTYRLFDQLEAHIEAVVVASRIAACQAMIAKRKNSRDIVRGMVNRGQQTAGANGQMLPSKIIEPGMINFIDTDEDIVGFNPTQPHQDFPGFIVAIARLLGLKFGLTVERVLMNFAGANYSVSRSTALQEQKAAEPAQDNYNASCFARVYPWFVSKMVKAGRVKRSPPADSWKYEWIPQGRPLVEPSKEAPGFEKLIALGIESPENLATERGYDWEKLKATIKRNREEFAELGLVYPGTAAATTKGQPPAAPNDPNADDSADPGTDEPTDDTDPENPAPREAVDAYGMAVRAGAITPQVEDEEAFRKQMKLPPMSADARKSWADDKVRRPITLVQPAGAASAFSNQPIDPAADPAVTPPQS